MPETIINTTEVATEVAAQQIDVQNTQSVYDLSREDLVIRTYFNEPSLTNKMVKLLDRDLFDDVLNKEIIKIIRGYIKKYGAPPTAQELVISLSNVGYSSDVRSKLAYICNAPCQPLRKDYCVSMIESFYQEQKFQQLLMKQAEALHAHDTSAIRDMIPSCRDALNFSLHANIGLDMHDDTKEAMDRLKQATACVPSRLAVVREYTTQKKECENAVGGWFKKCLSLFVGQPNVGKSMIMCSEAAFAVSLGYNVFYISLEMAEEKVWHRIVANLIDATLFDVLDLTPEECQEKIRNAHLSGSDHTGHLKVKRLKTTTTPTDIEQYIDEFEVATGEKLDLLVIDYIGIMQPDRRAGYVEENMFRDGEAKAEQIRDMCDERNIACLSAIQFNRSGYRNLDAGMENVSGSAGYNNTADLMITITQDSILKTNHLYAHMIIKNRFGDNDVPFCARNDFKKMRWYDATVEDITVYETARENQATQNNQVQVGGRPPRKPRNEQGGDSSPVIPEPTAGTPPATFPPDLFEE